MTTATHDTHPSNTPDAPAPPNNSAEQAAAVEAYLAAFLDQRPLPPNLAAAVRYALLGGGKRLRPILVIQACQTVGGRAEQAMAAAGAIELIHCFSLVHDDLPAMDDDDMRRGRPTLHIHTNEAMAVLAGDMMMGLAFELIATRISPPALAAGITDELSTATNNMIAGQVYDTLPDFDPHMAEIERLRTIHRNKTGALIRGACRMGAMCGGSDQGQIEAITGYGEAIGLMFQAVDDVLDVTQTTSHLGKNAHKDADQGKLTYPGLLGLEASRREIQKLRAAACSALEPLGPEAEPLLQLCQYMAARTR